MSVAMRLLYFFLKPVLPLPDEWDPQPRDVNGKEETLHLVSLEKDSKEYKKVQEKFLQTMSGKAVITNIERIQNPSMHNSYMVRKQIMDAKNGTIDNELELFHGTKAESIKAINVQGFDRSLCGANGTYMMGTNFLHFENSSAQDAKPILCLHGKGVVVLIPRSAVRWRVFCIHKFTPCDGNTNGNSKKVII